MYYGVTDAVVRLKKINVSLPWLATWPQILGSLQLWGNTEVTLPFYTYLTC